MSGALFAHTVSAAVALLAGWMALVTAKGSRRHRRSGMVFVVAMLVMAVTGAGIAAINGTEGSIVAGTLTAYLVATALMTVRTRTSAVRRADIASAGVALAIGTYSAAHGVAALATPSGSEDGIPFVVFFMFALVALLAGAGDIRRLRSHRFAAVPRLRRHIWRMCYALWIASASFFLGPRERVAMLLPEPLLHPLLLAMPPLAVLAVMSYWLWRVRAGHRRPVQAPAFVRVTE